MKKLIPAIPLILLGLGSTVFGQNTAPIAVNDTIYVVHDDSISFMEPNSNNVLVNDSDPNGNTLTIDTAIYFGSGFFQFDPVVANITRLSYKPALGFWGTDSVQYVLKDNGSPVMYDTAMIYFFVKRKSYELLDLNNIKARVDYMGLFQNPSNSTPGFEVPKGSGSNTIYAANLWVAGKKQGAVYSNATTFTNGLSYGNSGPIMNSIYYQHAYDYDWDRVWKVDYSDIIYHINNWNSAGYVPPQVFLDWPARGDINKGQAINLAPFYDYNTDGFYNPYDGDYPLIKGQQAIFFIYNDEREPLSNQQSMKIEVQGMAYTYNCASDSAINNTVFVDYTIINRSVNTYDSTYIGSWTDFDIGGATDDYVGCDVTRGTAYGYNGDANDEGGNGIIGYGVYPPAQGVVFLKGPFQDNDGVDNNYGIMPFESINGFGYGDGIIDNETYGLERHMTYGSFPQFPGDGGPSTGDDYYNYLRGYWKEYLGSSSPLVYGGNGHPSSGGTVTTKFAYPGSSDPLFFGTGGIVSSPSIWSEDLEGNPPGDRRSVGSYGPFSFYPGSVVHISQAYVFGRDYQTTGTQAGIAVMQERVDSIKSYFSNDFVSVCGGALGINEKNKADASSLAVYPNPFTNLVTIEYALKNQEATIEVYDLVGKQVLSQPFTHHSTVIDLSSYPKGMYFVTILDGDKRKTKKVFKQ